MRRTAIFLALAAILSAASASAADENLEAQVFAHLDSIRSLAGRYEQFTASGTPVTGAFYLQRPGRIHFAEDAKDGIILIADGSWIGVIDKQTGEAPRYPLDSTPFASLLSDLPSQDKSIHLIDISRHDRTVRAVFAKREEEALGEVTLVLREEPMELLGWQVKDAQGQNTVVRLDIEEINQPVAERLFRIHLFDGAP